MVRRDDTHDYHGWNWLPDRVLSLDKGTVRGLMGATIFKVQVGTESGREIAEFSPAGLKLVQAEIDKKFFFCGLQIVVQERWRIGIAPKEPEGVAVDEVGWGCGQANHAGIEVLDHFGEPPEQRAVGFIEDDKVEETWTELSVAECERLLCGDEEKFGFVACNAQLAMDIRAAFLYECDLPYKEQHPSRHHRTMQVEQPGQGRGGALRDAT